MDKEIDELKSQVGALTTQFNKVTKKKRKLEKRLNEENQIIKNLTQVCKRMKKAIREIGNYKEMLKNTTFKQDKQKEKLENNLAKIHQESNLFYNRAKREASI